jgi:hypothetical protein
MLPYSFITTAQAGSDNKKETKNEWQKLGERKVDFTRDYDDISIIGKQKYSELKISVTEAPIYLTRLEINYETGTTQVVEINNNFKAPGDFKIVKLQGGDRELSKIRMIYRTTPNRKDKKATVEIYGLKSEKAPENKDNAKKDNLSSSPSVVIGGHGGWRIIGTRTVEFSKDKDELVVVGADLFKLLKFKATDASIHMLKIMVQYESGDGQSIDLGSLLEEGKESKDIELNGGERRIKTIVFTYKTIPNHLEEKATIEVWGFKES